MRLFPIALLIFVPALLTGPAPAGAQTGDPAAQPAGDEADALFRKGKAAFAAGKPDQAYKLYREAWALKQTHDIAGNLAQIELTLGKKRDAAEHIAFALAHFPPTVQSERREGLKGVLDGLRKDLGVLRIRVTVADARVSVDGQSIGRAPIGQEAFVDPGAHVIHAELDGYRSADVRVEAAKGSAQDVEVMLTRVVTPSDPPLPPPVPQPEKRLIWPVTVGGALAGVTLVAGGSLLGVASNRASAADDLLAQLRQSKVPCAQPPIGQCHDLVSLRQSHDTLHNAGVPLLIGGGVLAAGTLVYALWPRAGAERRAGVLPVVVAGPGVAGLWLHGTWSGQ